MSPCTELAAHTDICGVCHRKARPLHCRLPNSAAATSSADEEAEEEADRQAENDAEVEDMFTLEGAPHLVS